MFMILNSMIIRINGPETVKVEILIHEQIFILHYSSARHSGKLTTSRN